MRITRRAILRWLRRNAKLPLMTNRSNVTRRRFLASSLLFLPQLDLAGSYFGLKAFAATRELQATPSCGDVDGATPQQTAGPFFKPRSPERKSLLEAGIRGSRIILEGLVRSTKCQPIHNALVDFWQADANGDYDNSGFRLRGHQFTDGAGKYRLDTIVPGVYPGRTRHIHVRVQAPNGPLLTTQLYFPGEPENRRDGIFNPKLLMAVNDSANVKAASFDFVLR
jgi:protocatechuate 3,4-dioxygenase beta subunit